MRAGVHCQILKSNKDVIKQVLLPLNDELQIHIYKDNDSYHFEAIPIISTTKTEAFTLTIEHSPYLDIMRKTGSKTGIPPRRQRTHPRGESGIRRWPH
jgi:hypothetical protein